MTNVTSWKGKIIQLPFKNYVASCKVHSLTFDLIVQFLVTTVSLTLKSKNVRMYTVIFLALSDLSR